MLRAYLRSVATDFTRVVTALTLAMTQASSDRPDLAAVLIRSQAIFANCMVLIHVQLQLYRFGIGAVDVGALLKVFEGMRLELRALVLPTEDSAVYQGRASRVGAKATPVTGDLIRLIFPREIKSGEIRPHQKPTEVSKSMVETVLLASCWISD